MPCGDSPGINRWAEEQDRAEKLRPFWEEHRLMTKLLCEECREHERQNLPMSKDLKAWWERHQGDDSHERR